ncbi:hypothetical protein HY494_00225 [Candidatus Woesearchaeota archaeon]|nr:hypothetical protein [Candidatus Woesearchaeota archaeon]
MTIKLLLILVSMLIILGCYDLSTPSSKPFELNVTSVTSEGVSYEVKYNADFSVNDCRFVFVSDDGNEYEENEMNMYFSGCKGTHMLGVKQKFTTVFSEDISDKSGTFYVNLWSDELANPAQYKRYSASFRKYS